MAKLDKATVTASVATGKSQEEVVKLVEEHMKSLGCKKVEKQTLPDGTVQLTVQFERLMK